MELKNKWKLLTIAAAVALANTALADEYKTLARSKDLGVEVKVKLADGKWCSEKPVLNLETIEDSNPSEKDIAALVGKVGKLFESKCDVANEFAINRLANDKSFLFTGSALIGNGWELVINRPKPKYFEPSFDNYLQVNSKRVVKTTIPMTGYRNFSYQENIDDDPLLINGAPLDKLIKFDSNVKDYTTSNIIAVDVDDNEFLEKTIKSVFTAKSKQEEFYRIGTYGSEFPTSLLGLFDFRYFQEDDFVNGESKHFEFLSNSERKLLAKVQAEKSIYAEKLINEFVDLYLSLNSYRAKNLDDKGKYGQLLNYLTEVDFKKIGKATVDNKYLSATSEQGLIDQFSFYDGYFKNPNESIFILHSIISNIFEYSKIAVLDNSAGNAYLSKTDKIALIKQNEKIHKIHRVYGTSEINNEKLLKYISLIPNEKRVQIIKNYLNRVIEQEDKGDYPNLLLAKQKASTDYYDNFYKKALDDTQRYNSDYVARKYPEIVSWSDKLRIGPKTVVDLGERKEYLENLLQLTSTEEIRGILGKSSSYNIRELLVRYELEEGKLDKIAMSNALDLIKLIMVQGYAMELGKITYESIVNNHPSKADYFTNITITDKALKKRLSYPLFVNIVKSSTPTEGRIIFNRIAPQFFNESIQSFSKNIGVK